MRNDRRTATHPNLRAFTDMAINLPAALLVVASVHQLRTTRCNRCVVFTIAYPSRCSHVWPAQTMKIGAAPSTVRPADIPDPPEQQQQPAVKHTVVMLYVMHDARIQSLGIASMHARSW